MLKSQLYCLEADYIFESQSICFTATTTTSQGTTPLRLNVLTEFTDTKDLF